MLGIDIVKNDDGRVDWHLNKGTSVTIILLLITNILSSVWWAATLTKDVETLKLRPDVVERIIRLETTVDLHSKYFNKYNTALDKIITTVNRIDKEQARRASIIKRSERHFNKFNEGK